MLVYEKRRKVDLRVVVSGGVLEEELASQVALVCDGTANPSAIHHTLIALPTLAHQINNS